MQELILIGIGTLLANHYVLLPILGLPPYPNDPYKEGNWVSYGLILALIVISSVSFHYFLYRYLLEPANLSYLSMITFILIVVLITKLREIITESRISGNQLIKYNPQIFVSGMIIALTVYIAKGNQSLSSIIIFSILSAFTGAFVLHIFHPIHIKATKSEIADAFKGAPITLINIGIILMVCMGFM